MSQQTSYNSSRRNSGASASAGLWSRRNSDADTRREVDQQMFPDVTPAKTCSAESGAQRVTVKQTVVRPPIIVTQWHMHNGFLCFIESRTSVIGTCVMDTVQHH